MRTTLVAGQANVVPLPVDPDDDAGASAVQLVGAVKLRKPGCFDLEGLSELKRQLTMEGGASSGGYLLSSLAVDPHSLIVLSTVPLIFTPTDELLFLNVWIPSEAIPTFKGETLDVEYVIVRKRLRDGHLEMAIVNLSGSSAVHSRVSYSRDCPCFVGSPFETPSVALDHHQIAFYEKLMFDAATEPTIASSIQFSLKNNQQEQQAVLGVKLAGNEVTEMSLEMSQPTNNIDVEVYRLERIHHPSSYGNAVNERRRLVMRKSFTDVLMASYLDIPVVGKNIRFINNLVFSSTFKVRLVLDGMECEVLLRDF